MKGSITILFTVVVALVTARHLRGNQLLWVATSNSGVLSYDLDGNLVGTAQHPVDNTWTVNSVFLGPDDRLWGSYSRRNEWQIMSFLKTGGSLGSGVEFYRASSGANRIYQHPYRPIIYITDEEQVYEYHVNRKIMTTLLTTEYLTSIHPPLDSLSLMAVDDRENLMIISGRGTAKNIWHFGSLTGGYMGLFDQYQSQDATGITGIAFNNNDHTDSYLYVILSKKIMRFPTLDTTDGELLAQFTFTSKSQNTAIQFSPDGSKLFFAQDGNIFAVNTTGHDPQKNITRLFSVEDLADGLILNLFITEPCKPACVQGYCTHHAASGISYCDCASGYGGDVCATPLCLGQNRCHNAGVCVSPGVCDCSDTGFSGDNCDIPDPADEPPSSESDYDGDADSNDHYSYDYFDDYDGNESDEDGDNAGTPLGVFLGYLCYIGAIVVIAFLIIFTAPWSIEEPRRNKTNENTPLKTVDQS